MIIKKKFANVEKQAIETEENREVEEQQVAPTEEAMQEAAPVEAVSVEEQINDVFDSIDDLDFSLNNITFEQREERREGSRRRGYRRTQDRNIISRAQNEAIAIKETAKNEGYKAGLDKADADIQAIKAKFAEFYKYKDELYNKVSECIMDISMEIAKRIIKNEVEVDKQATLSIIKNALEEVNKTENKITLKVMPQEVEIVKDKLPEVFADNYFEAKISVVPDNSITEGGVIVETSNGIIDATIQSQLQIIEKVLKKQSEGQQ